MFVILYECFYTGTCINVISTCLNTCIGFFFGASCQSQCKVHDTKSCNDLMCHETQGHNVEVTIIIHVQCIINTIWNVMIYWNHKKFHLLCACQIVVCVSFAVYIFNCLVLGSMIKYYIKNQLKPCGYLHKCKKITYA